MSLVKRNIIANFGGKAWQAVMSLVFIPLYIKFMGVEAYGLVGIFASLQVIFTVLDMGLSTTLNREMARLSAQAGRVAEMRDLVRTLEVIYWGIAILIGVTVVGLSSPIAHYWVKADKLSPTTIKYAIMIIGGVLAFQWPVTLYSGGLRGLQKQVLLNGIEIGVATLRGVGAVLILWVVSPTIVAFFTWQICVSFIRTSVLAVFLWRNISKFGHRPHFQKKIIKNIWRFAAGMTGISISAIILTQTDKIILSKLLTLEIFGYYSLATVMASALYVFISPVFAALFPRFSQLVSLNDQEALKVLYHNACQLMSVMIMPAAVVVSFFSSEILLLWTGDLVIVANTNTIVSILIIGTVFNGLMNLPYGLQLAHGWIKLSLYSNIIASIILVPVIYFLCKYYGAVGAATAWVVLNSGYVLICIHIMHRRLLTAEKWTWYGKDVGLPLIIAFLTCLVWHFFMPDNMLMPAMIIYLISATSATLIATAIATPVTRHWLLQKIIKFKIICRGEEIAES